MEEKTIKDRAKDYYRGERINNAGLILFGSAGLFWTFVLFQWRQGHLSTGIFYSALPLSLFFLLTGVFRFWRSIKRYRILRDAKSGEEYLFELESQHLAGRKKRFIRKRKVDSVGMLLGFVLLAGALGFRWNHFFLGTAFSITTFSSLLLAFDLFGQFRTEEFLYQIEKFKKKSEAI